jgi:hypothetical protein
MTKPDEIDEAGPESVVRRRRGKWTAQQRRRIIADSRVAGATVQEWRSGTVCALICCRRGGVRTTHRVQRSQ